MKNLQNIFYHVYHCAKAMTFIYFSTEYRDIFDKKSEKYEKITMLFEQKLKISDKLLKSRKHTVRPGEPL